MHILLFHAFTFSEPVKSDTYPMLSDINLIAWGICEDSRSHHEGGLFRELLFVVGDHGLLTVHAFGQPIESTESLELMPDKQSGEWVEWGPSTDNDVGQRKWLQTLLPKVKTVKSEGKFCTRFPEKSEFPSSAKVVSFNLFENDSTLLRDLFEEDDLQKILVRSSLQQQFHQENLLTPCGAWGSAS